MADENRTADDLKKPTAQPPTPIRKEGPGGPGLDDSRTLSLALSGGGHRGSLFGLGVLMAMRDAGREPKQISSVSGGSITNAFLAYRYFAKVPTNQSADENLWEHETQLLFETIVYKGVVTKAWIWFLLAFLILPPGLFVVLVSFGMLPLWWVTLLSSIAWAIVLLLRGLLIEWLISRCYFDRLCRKVDLAAIGHSKIEHVICCTDLVTGRPLYASTRAGGQIFRTFVDRPVGIGPRTVELKEISKGIQSLGVLYSAPTMSVATLVRASAGFPGIPPRRVQLNSFERAVDDRGKYENESSLAFLSDGGIWNNLATQPFEDGFLWGKYGPWVVVTADASASLGYDEKPMRYHIPVLAEFCALYRQSVIQNVNTVGPRRVGYQDWIRREVSSHRSSRFASERLYPVVSIMELPEEVKARLASAACADNPADHFLKEDELKWREERREKTRTRARDLERATDAPKPLTQEIDSHAASNFRRLSDLSAVGASGRDVDTRDSVSSYPTTLDKIERAMAIAIVGRGYANTAITLYLTGLVNELVFPKGWLGREKETKCSGRGCGAFWVEIPSKVWNAATGVLRRWKRKTNSSK